MAKFFGTNGIRGVFDKEITLEFIHDMTLAIGSYFQSGTILVGYDGRDSSPVLCKIVSSALNSIGLDCKIAGVVPTPCLEFAVKKFDYAGGLMITASHNPSEYNGIKPVANDGVEISREDELKIEEIYLQKTWKSKPKTWGITTKENKIIESYLSGILSHVDSNKIKSNQFKVVLDLGNGAQAVAAPNLCKLLNCKTILINDSLDGKFPGRGSEPTPENLSELSKIVIENNADLGIAFDGDGDRSIFCDENGKILTGDKSALVLTKHILKENPNSLVVTCLNSGSTIELLANNFDSEVIRTKVGSVEVSRKMVPTNALIGFEENGGFMYGNHNQVRDGCMTLALMLDLLTKSRHALSNEVNLLPPSFTTKDKVACPPEKVSELLSQLKSESPDSDMTDGIKITIDSKSWIMIRPSGTEPIIRIYVESESQEKLDDLMSEYLQKVTSIIARQHF